MKHSSSALAITLTCVHFLTPSLFATGDFFEEPLATLPELLRLDPLPAKSLPEILRETGAPEFTGPYLDFRQELLALAECAPALDSKEAVETIDTWLRKAREEQTSAQSYQRKHSPAYGSSLSNLLHDVRDLFAAETSTPQERAEFIRWRVEHADWFGVEWHGRPVRFIPEQEKEEHQAALVKQLAASSPALRPHWLYLQGAHIFRKGQDEASQQIFEQIHAAHPEHPRAEAALFMSGRCQLSRSRNRDYRETSLTLNLEHRPRVKELFDAYLAKYSRGRFAADVLGWLGAFAHDGADYSTALGYYLQQLDLPEHPELRQPAALMCEKVLARMAAAPQHAGFAEVARHPRVAMALVYLLINTTEAEHFNEEIDDVEAVVEWRKKVLPNVAKAIAAEAKLYEREAWKPRYLAMLVHAASAAGQQEEALKLLELGGAAAVEAEDLAFAQGVVLQRAKRPREAILALRSFVQKFPRSRLLRGAQLRLALALLDDHQAGHAVLELQKIEATAKVSRDPETRAERRRDGVDPAFVRELIDAQLNFAPIAEFAALLREPALEPLSRLRFSEVLAQRHLAREDFAEAKKFLTPAQWELFAGPLERLTDGAKAARTPAAKATAFLKLGDAWAAIRGKLLTAPLDTEERRSAVFEGAPPDANLRRVASAEALGMKGNFSRDLEQRDELRHAFHWWLEASDVRPGLPASATGLWRALAAMPQIADVSAFTLDQAMERKWGTLSRKLHGRLLREFPKSPEAQRFAVWWDIPEIDENDTEAAAGDPLYRDLAGQELLGREVFAPNSGHAERKEDEALLRRVVQLEKDAASAPAEELKAAVESLRKEAGERFASLEGSVVINFLDDLSTFLQEPDAGAEVRARYMALRTEAMRQGAVHFYPRIPTRSGAAPAWDAERAKGDQLLRAEIQTALRAAEMKPITDYLVFLEAAVVANQLVSIPIPGTEKDGDSYTIRGRDYALLEKLTRSFLERFPRSRKREAALLLHARALYHSSSPVVFKKRVTWPQAPRWEGGFETMMQPRAPFEPRRVTAALDRYEREFPGGRYAAEIRGFRAAVALRQRDWPQAVQFTLAQFDDAARPALRGEAADRLGQLFARLADERDRAELLAAIKQNARVRELLVQYLAHESEAHPLKWMKSWTRAQLTR